MSLIPGVSLTLVCEDDAWRFVSWASYVAMLSPPPPAECAKRFPTAEDAAAYFRAIVPQGAEWHPAGR
jgi:hypothetical protein